MRLFFLMVILSTNIFVMAQDSVKQNKNFDLAGIPIASYNTSYGAIVGANTMAFFNINKTDTISPASVVGLGGGYSQNKSLFATAFVQLYFKEDTWRTAAAFGVGSINFQYFEDIDETSDGDFVDFNTVHGFVYFKGLRKITGRLYGGAFIKFQRSNTTFKNGADSSQNVHMNGIGPTVSYDTRSDVYYPRSGVYASISFLFNPSWMGSDSVFNSIRTFVNWYHTINKKDVFATRISVFSSVGDVPFSGQHTVGGRDIRGYTDGKYRGEQEYSAQAEYRWNFYKRWGAVGFFGVAFVEKPSSGALPGGGIGIRFKIIRSRDINIGIDGALGKDDSGIYFRIGEAF